MESFLDEYQLVRLLLAAGGLTLTLLYALVGGWNDSILPIAAVLVLVSGHALWCRLRQIRSPRTMVALDLTLWGWIMVVIADTPEVATATLAFLILLTVLFADGYWVVVFLAYILGWYGLAYFQNAGVNAEAVGAFASVAFTAGAIGVVMYRVRRWLGRLDANRSQMLGTVSHELRNNLTGMLGLTELVATSKGMSPEEVVELSELAHQQAVDATEIVEDLLTASRLERSALTVAREEVDVAAEVATTVRRFRGEGTVVEVVATGDMTAAWGDSLRVRQVLRNLISNAVRYGGDRIAVTVRLHSGVVEVVVADDGDGVPAEDEATIFLPYRRSTHTRRHDASIGLGLWICRQLAHAMGGDLAYRRLDGETQFVLTLPVAGQETETPATASRHRHRLPSLRSSEGSTLSAVSV